MKYPVYLCDIPHFWVNTILNLPYKCVDFFSKNVVLNYFDFKLWDAGEFF